MPFPDGDHLAHDDRFESIIADVTCAVYQVMLSEVRPLNWLDLQLALWNVVRSRFEAWGLEDVEPDHEETVPSFPGLGRTEFSDEDGVAISTHTL